MTETGWLQQACSRSRWHWPLKTPVTLACITAFMWVYFLLLRHPLFPVTLMPLTPLDRLIAFQPWSIVPYASLWLYLSLVPLLLHERRELLAYLSAVGVLSLTGFAVFLFWPTAIPEPGIDWAQHPAVAFLKSVDASGNACPSLHAAFATLSGVWLNRLLRQIGTPGWLRWLNVAWCLLILYSTLATKQHVALDLEAGMALGLGVALLHLPFLPALRMARREPESG